MTTQIKGDATSTFGSDIDVTGNVITDAPAFRAYSNANQTLSATTLTKVQFNTEEFDTTTDYDNSTNYRFTPSVEGYYLISTNILFVGVARTIVDFRKNGDAYQRIHDIEGTNSRGASGSILVYLNGSTDYVEVYAWRGTAGDIIGVASTTNASRCSIQGHLARAV